MSVRSTHMRAAVKVGESSAVEVRTVEIPRAGPGQAVLRVEAAGVCGTDLHILDNEYGHDVPVILGHEFTGAVVEVGSEVDERWIGERVACETYFSACETCTECRAGFRNLCSRRRSIGSYENGGFAEYVLVPVINMHRIPDHVDEGSGALLEPLACVAHCLLDPPVMQPGNRVAVIGPGAMGLLSAQVALASGADVTVSGLASDADRLRCARKLGLETTSEPLTESVFDVVIECSGSPGGARAALDGCRPQGKYVQVGIFGAPVTVPMDRLLYKELTVTSGFASTPESWEAALRLVEQRCVELKPLITNRVPLERFAEAVTAAEQGGEIKILVDPSVS